MLVPSVKHHCHYNHIQSLHSNVFRYQFFVRGVRLWNIISYHLATKPYLESFHTAAFQWISPLQWYEHLGTNTWCLNQNSALFFCLSCFFVLLNFLYLCIYFFNYYYYFYFFSCCTCLIFVCTTTGISP